MYIYLIKRSGKYNMLVVELVQCR